MFNIRKIFHICLMMVFLGQLFSPIISFAQEEGDAEGAVDETKDDILAVAGCGIGGAVLGLSTLSFVDEPKKHTKNIIMGAALGIVAGVGIVAFNQATKSKEMFYQEGKPQTAVDFSTTDRVTWHEENQMRYSSEEPSVLGWSSPF